MIGWRQGRRLICETAVAGTVGMLTGAFGLPAHGTEPALVLTQTPRMAAVAPSKNPLDSRYPPGSRLVLAKPPFAAAHTRILSEGLTAAASPVVSYDGRMVVFAGKAGPDRDWQIYESTLDSGRPRALTSVPGGAMQPALLPHGSLVFAAPADAASRVPQLYVQGQGGKSRQLTFAPTGAADPSMLLDGRILFVSGRPSETRGVGAGTALYTVNNDGTEVMAFACQHDPPAFLWSPKQLNDGRVAFLVSADGNHAAPTTADCVRMARPFVSRSPLLPEAPVHIRSVRPSGESNLLVCAEVPPAADGQGAWACFRVVRTARSLGSPLFVDPGWNTIEAVEAVSSSPPLGRISTMEPAKRTGQILCLDVNDTTFRKEDRPAAKATRVRLTAAAPAGGLRVLGEVDVQADGSFMAEVPADVPLGFEALDQQGKIVRRELPTLWVRSGENRSCVGCHAAHNRAPHNHRPLAVRAPLPRLCSPPENALAGKAP
ncbi:MAG TPA: hypothetical protein VJA21_26785 [Verrucomicrobiae bacterium]